MILFFDSFVMRETECLVIVKNSENAARINDIKVFFFSQQKLPPLQSSKFTLKP